jgi:hypothetical protein
MEFELVDDMRVLLRDGHLMAIDKKDEEKNSSKDGKDKKQVMTQYQMVSAVATKKRKREREKGKREKRLISLIIHCSSFSTTSLCMQPKQSWWIRWHKFDLANEATVNWKFLTSKR